MLCSLVWQPIRGAVLPPGAVMPPGTMFMSNRYSSLETVACAVESETCASTIKHDSVTGVGL